MLTSGRWVLLDRDHRGVSSFPASITVHEGNKKIGTLTKMQVIALMRYRSVEWVVTLDGNGRQRDLTVIGDVEAYFDHEGIDGGLGG